MYYRRRCIPVRRTFGGGTWRAMACLHDRIAIAARKGELPGLCRSYCFWLFLLLLVCSCCSRRVSVSVQWSPVQCPPVQWHPVQWSPVQWSPVQRPSVQWSPVQWPAVQWLTLLKQQEPNLPRLLQHGLPQRPQRLSDFRQPWTLLPLPAPQRAHQYVPQPS